MMMMTIVCVYSRWTRIRNWPFSLSFFLDFTSPIFSRFSHCPSSLVLLLYECGQRVIKYTCVHVCGQSKLGRHDPLLRLDRYVLILSLSLALMSLNIGYCMLIDLMCPDWCSLSFRFRDQMTAEYIPMSWKREEEALSNGWPTTSCVDLLLLPECEEKEENQVKMIWKNKFTRKWSIELKCFSL